MKTKITREEETSRQEAIAKMLGWYQEQPVTYHHDTWFKVSENAIIVAYSKHNNYPFNDLPFNRDYNYLMQAFDFMRTVPGEQQSYLLPSEHKSKKKKLEHEILLDRFEFNRNSIFLTVLTWEGMWKDNTIYYIVGENAETYQNAMFLAISDFAILYNAYKERNPEKLKNKTKKNGKAKI